MASVAACPKRQQCLDMPSQLLFVSPLPALVNRVHLNTLDRELFEAPLNKLKTLLNRCGVTLSKCQLLVFPHFYIIEK